MKRSDDLHARIDSLRAEIERARVELMLLENPSLDQRSKIEEELARVRAEIGDAKKETPERTPAQSLASAYVVVILCLLTVYLVNTCR